MKRLAAIGAVATVFYSSSILASEVSEQDKLLDLLLPTELVHVILKNQVSTEIINRVYSEFKLPVGSFREKDVGAILKEVDRISSVVTKDASLQLSALEKITHQRFRGTTVDGPTKIYVTQGTPENELAKRHTRFVLSAGKALGYYSILKK